MQLKKINKWGCNPFPPIGKIKLQPRDTGVLHKVDWVNIPAYHLYHAQGGTIEVGKSLADGKLLMASLSTLTSTGQASKLSLSIQKNSPWKAECNAFKRWNPSWMTWGKRMCSVLLENSLHEGRKEFKWTLPHPKVRKYQSIIWQTIQAILRSRINSKVEVSKRMNYASGEKLHSTQSKLNDFFPPLFRKRLFPFEA